MLDYVVSPSVRVLVGTEKPCAREFFAHEALICQRSRFFANAMNGSWIESDERKVPLPEDEPDVFALYLKVIYGNKLPTKATATTLPPQGEEPEEYLMLSKLYVLSEKLMDDTTKTIVLTAITARFEEALSRTGCFSYPKIDAVQTIYAGTPSNSPARQLLLQLYTDFGSSDLLANANIVDEAPYVPRDFLYDLSLSLLKIRALPMNYKVAKQKLEDLEASADVMRKELSQSKAQCIQAEETNKSWKAAHASVSAVKDEVSLQLEETKQEMAKLPGGVRRLHEMQNIHKRR